MPSGAQEIYPRRPVTVVVPFPPGGVGQVEALSTGPSSVLQQIRAGRLRVLAHWGEDRLPVLPEVPSLRELGVPIEAARFAAQDPRATQSVTASGSAMQFLDATEFGRFVQADARSIEVVVQRIGSAE